jgi:predicted nucleic acid-binding protein
LVFGGDPRRPLQHLGEAETLVLIQRRPGFAESVWITDDGEAARFARRKGIAVLDTVDIIRQAVAEGLVVAHEGHRLLHAMTSRGRHLRDVPQRPEDLLR